MSVNSVLKGFTVLTSRELSLLRAGLVCHSLAVWAETCHLASLYSIPEAKFITTGVALGFKSDSNSPLVDLNYFLISLQLRQIN